MALIRLCRGLLREARSGRRHSYPFQLLDDAAVQVLIHFFVFDCIVSSLLCRVDACIKVLKLMGELDANLERICHDSARRASPASSVGRLSIDDFAKWCKMMNSAY